MGSGYLVEWFVYGFGAGGVVGLRLRVAGQPDVPVVFYGVIISDDFGSGVRVAAQEQVVHEEGSCLWACEVGGDAEDVPALLEGGGLGGGV